MWRPPCTAGDGPLTLTSQPQRPPSSGHQPDDTSPVGRESAPPPEGRGIHTPCRVASEGR